MNTRKILASVLSICLSSMVVWWGMHFPGAIPLSVHAEFSPPTIVCTPTPTPTPLPSVTPQPTPCATPTPYPYPAEVIPEDFRQFGGADLSWVVEPVRPIGSTPTPTPSPKPAVILIHGGNWNSGSAIAVNHEGADIAAAGYFVVSVNYELCPPNYIPGQRCHEYDGANPGDRLKQLTNDIKAFIAAVRNDPRCKDRKVGLVGGSAGANLAVWCAMDTNPSGSDGAEWPFWMGENGDTRPDCAAMLSCIYDFSDWTPPTGSSETDPYYVTFGMKNFVQSLNPATLKTWSPISLLPDAIDAGFKPLFMITSYGDHPTAYHQLVTMVCALRNADVPETSYQTLVIEGSEHSFGYWGSEGSQADKTVGDDVIAFLDAHLK